MNKSDVTIEMLRDALSCDKEKGELTWKGRHSHTNHRGKKAGQVTRDGYVNIRFHGHRFAAHRVIWAIVFGQFPDGPIDHKNGIRTDNSIGNLRAVTTQINNQNRRKASRNSSTGFLGVTFSKSSSQNKPYSARIKVNGIKLFLGGFTTPEVAHGVYMAAKRKFHPGFAR